MYSVKKKPMTPNIIWDAEKGKTLCRFINGELKTNDEVLVEKLKELDYDVTGEADKDQDTDSDDGGIQTNTPETQNEDASNIVVSPTSGTGKRRSRK